MIIKKEFDFYWLLSAVIVVSVVQAVLSNLASISVPYLLPLFIVCVLSTRFLFSGHQRVPSIIYFALLSFVFTGAWFFFSEVEVVKEVYYQLNFLLSIVLVGLLSGFITYKHESKNGVYFDKLVLVFLVVSIGIHFFLWDYFASVIQGEKGIGGLLMDGAHRRLFSLFFNPLATSFSFLFLLCILLILGEVRKGILLAICAIILLTMSRTGIVCMVFLWALYLLKNKKFTILVLFLFISLLIVLVVPQVNVAVTDLLAGRDKTGSADEHLRNILIGLEYSLKLKGQGFVSAENYGGWNVRLESTPFQFGFTSGFGLFLFTSFFVIYSGLKILLRFGFFAGAMYFSVVPIYLFFPLHTFNSAIIMFLVLSFVWRWKGMARP